MNEFLFLVLFILYQDLFKKSIKMRKKLPKSAVFRLFLIFFVSGIGLASFFNFTHFLIYLIFLISATLSIFFWKKPYWRFLFLAGIFLVAGIWRYQLSLPQTNESKIWFYNGQQISFSGHF